MDPNVTGVFSTRDQQLLAIRRGQLQLRAAQCSRLCIRFDQGCTAFRARLVQAGPLKLCRQSGFLELSTSACDQCLSSQLDLTQTDRVSNDFCRQETAEMPCQTDDGQQAAGRCVCANREGGTSGHRAVQIQPDTWQGHLPPLTR